MLIKGNDLTVSARTALQSHNWKDPNKCIDLHAQGVHYFDPDILPTNIDIMTHAAYYHRGLTAPNNLPSYFPEDIQQRMEEWLKFNYFKLTSVGLDHLGSEPNISMNGKWEDSKVKVLIVRISTYHVLDGAFGHFIVNNFAQDFQEDIFVDYSFLPEREDFGKYLYDEMPIHSGLISKRPMMDFDLVFFSHCYPAERIVIPFSLSRSGIPMYRHERWNHDFPYYKKCPIIGIAGIGAAFIENMLGDHPVYGPGQNSMFDHVLIGEGELLWLKYLQEYIQTVTLDGGTKEDFLQVCNNKHHQGVYDPTKILFEYADKKHISKTE